MTKKSAASTSLKTNSDSYLTVASELAMTAGRRLMELRLTTLVKERKADYSLVTNADREADQIIRQGLRRHFPGHSILTEESGLDGPADAEFVWVVDPLDGTRAYARGSEGFGVQIGLLREGKPFAGVVMDPWRNRIYEAQSGEGAFLSVDGQRERLEVSQRADWREMPIVTSTDFPHKLKEKLQAQIPCPWVPPINSVGIKVGVVVRREADLYVNHHPVHYWDTAAPQIILEEAGGMFTFTDGRPLAYDLKAHVRHTLPTVITNGQRHAEFLGIIQNIL